MRGPIEKPSTNRRSGTKGRVLCGGSEGPQTRTVGGDPIRSRSRARQAGVIARSRNESVHPNGRTFRSSSTGTTKRCHLVVLLGAACGPPPVVLLGAACG